MDKNLSELKFRVRRQKGTVVIECSLKVMKLYDRDELLNMILPQFPKNEEVMTFRIKKVKN